MFIGPVFTRETVTAPRRPRLFVWRAAYVLAFWVLMCTLWMVLTGTQSVRTVGELARFGRVLFGVMAPLQMAVVIFFAALATASAVAQEKDKKTLILLLMTRLTNSELVLGKLMASMLNVLMFVLAALPLFLIAGLFGGVSFGEILAAFAVTFAAVFAAGSLGSLIALWREKTFQTLALVALILVIWLGGWELAYQWFGETRLDGLSLKTIAAWFLPWRAIAPDAQGVTSLGPFGGAEALFVLAAAVLTVLLNAVAIWRVRVWNPSREKGDKEEREEEGGSVFSAELAERALDKNLANAGSATQPASRAATSSARSAPKKTRAVWDNPVLWREICTWAYGRKVILIRLVYVALAAAVVVGLYLAKQSPEGVTRTAAALAVVPLFIVSLKLINAQAVTAMTTERDGGALDILLVTDVTPGEFIFGKLGGVFYNTKEMVLLPLLVCVELWWLKAINGETLFFLIGGMLVMDCFAAMVGIHAGMTYGNSRTAIATSLGTLFFLFIGVATCMRIMLAFGSFQGQLPPFIAIVLGGGVGLYVALGVRNPSRAIALASLVCPFFTFYAITSYLLGNTLSVFLAVVGTYGFTTLALLVPAVAEFDVATGRTTGAE